MTIGNAAGLPAGGDATQERPAPRGPVRMFGLEIDIAGMSEQGPRPENQDAYAAEAFARSGILAVADGMGGERGGRLAAETAIRTVLAAAPIRSLDDARFATRQADRAVAEAAALNPNEREGMGCALGLIALVENVGAGGPVWLGAHVGDIRIISRSPDGTVRLETRDHTPAFARWEAGEIGLDQIPDSEGANRLQRAVGHGAEPDATWIPARPGWAYLLISDGVFKCMRLDELGQALALPSAQAAVDSIREKVAQRGPDDNFTAVVTRILGDSASPGVTMATPAVALSAPAAFTSAPAPRGQRRGRGVGGLLAGLVTVASLALAGWLWMTRDPTLQDRAIRSAAEAASLRQQMQILQTQMDSLRAALTPASPSARDPFGVPPATGGQR